MTIDQLVTAPYPSRDDQLVTLILGGYEMAQKVLRRPRRPTATDLKRAGVTLEDESRFILRCDKCETGWSPNYRKGGKLYHGYWRCPNGCNADAER